MKIAIVGPVYPYRGGISHSNTLLCTNLSKRHDVVAYSFKMLYPSFLYPGKEQKYGVKKKLGFKSEYIINSINPINWFNTFLKIKKQNPDLIILQWWTVFLAPMYIKLLSLIRIFTKIKICILCQNVLEHEEKFFDKIAIKSVFKKAHYFVVLAKSDGKNVKKLIPNAKVKLLIEPTYESHFLDKKMTKKQAKKMIGLDGNTILFFGFVRKYKGLQYLIDSMPYVLKKIKAELLIVGEFWDDKSGYIEQINRLGIEKNVKVIDKFVPDEEVSKYFMAADVFVLPYTSATQSGIIQIAFGYKKPVIVTNVGGLTDLVENDKNGLIVPPKNPKALANAIISYFNEDKEQKFVAEINARKKIFEWDKDKEAILFHGL